MNGLNCHYRNLAIKTLRKSDISHSLSHMIEINEKH